MERNKYGKLDCPIDGCDRVGENGFDGPQGLGSHKLTAHGIRGTSTSTLFARRKKEPRPAAQRPSRATHVPNEFGLYDCPAEGCDRRGRNGIPNPQGLGKHLKSHEHGGTSKRKRRQKVEANDGRAITPYVPPFPRHRHHDEPEMQEPVVAQVEGSPVPPEDYLNYCPRCKYDLAAAKAAIVPEVRAIAFQFCPSCKLNLAVVSLALSPEMQGIPADQTRGLFSVVQKVSRRLR
jgi:hypothetical protein